MKHYIYIDKEILNSYISQIYGGILDKEKVEKQNLTSESNEIITPEEKIKSTINAGIPAIVGGKIEVEAQLNEKETNSIETTDTIKEVVEKIYHDNLLDNLISYIDKSEDVLHTSENLEVGKYVEFRIPFNFTNNDYLSAISNTKFKDSYQKIMNLTGQKEADMKTAKGAMELVGNFANFIEASFPTKYLIINDNLIIPLNERYLKESPNMIEFKYGGEINIIGKITKDCSLKENGFGFFNTDFAKSLNNVKDVLNSMYLPNYEKSFIVTPIALYFN